MATYHLPGLIGMGGDRLSDSAASEAVERAMGEELRSRHRKHLDDLFWTIQPVDGPAELLETLHERGYTAILASSSDADLTDRLLGLVERSAVLINRVLTGSDAEHSKPNGELIANGLKAVDAGRTVVVGYAV